MFNVTIINIKKTAKYIITLLISLIFVYMITKGMSKIKDSEIIQLEVSDKLIKCLSREIPAIESLNSKSISTIKEEHEEEKEDTFIEKILNTELAQVQNIKKDIIEANEEQISSSNASVEKEDKNNNDAEPESSNGETQIVTQNPITENSNIEINGVKIKNETSYEISSDIMNQSIDINKNNAVIFHTHTCESYTPSENYQYDQTGNYRTTDLNYSVARVGDELEKDLNKYGFNVIHDKTYHDYPAYTGSYTRSKETVENILKSTPSDIIIDLHRDAIGSKSNYDPSVKIGDETVARLMFVVGTNGGGLYHPQWQENLQFAINVQQKANEMYPGLFKPIIVRNSRYNQHLGKAACIIEVGATGNTLDQCLASMKYLAKVLSEF